MQETGLSWIASLLVTSPTSVYPFFLITALLVLTAYALCRKWEFYRSLIKSEEAASRFHAIDGLRGFLALAVFIHHAVISYYYYQHGRWEVPPSGFYTLCGQVGVGFFFMITAFLFWSKGLSHRSSFQVQPFLWSRITRLVPMYLFSVVCVFLAAAVASHFERHVSLYLLVKEFVFWSSFGFLEGPTINGLAGSQLINTVYWSLPYEWLFYLFLPLGLIFARGPGFLFLAVLSAVIIQWTSMRHVEWNFLFGAVSAMLISKWRHRSRSTWAKWNSWPVSAALLGLLLLLFTSFSTGYGLGQSLLLFIVFLGLASGNSLLGLLTCRAARFLGTISYSVYLLHSVVLYLVLWCVDRSVPIRGMPADRYWVLVAVMGVVVTVLASVTYRYVEHPLLKRAMPRWLSR